MGKLFVKDCRCVLPASTPKDGTEASGKVLFKVIREDGTEIAEFAQFRRASGDGERYELESRWLVPSPKTLTAEERSKLTEFMEAGNARLREMLREMLEDQQAIWKNSRAYCRKTGQ